MNFAYFRNYSSESSEKEKLTKAFSKLLGRSYYDIIYIDNYSPQKQLSLMLDSMSQKGHSTLTIISLSHLGNNINDIIDVLGLLEVYGVQLSIYNVDTASGIYVNIPNTMKKLMDLKGIQVEYDAKINECAVSDDLLYYQYFNGIE